MGYSESDERSMAHWFQAHAPSRTSTCPDKNDYVSWLSLMQHYGLPTRLLDWTESIMVAAFFAVEKHEGGSAAVWALAPDSFNKMQGWSRGIQCSNGEVALACAAAAFGDFTHGEEHRKKTVAVILDEIDSRMMVQQGRFTIHGTSTPLNRLPQTENYLAKFEVPDSARAYLRNDLVLLGIERHALFPDLQNLAEHVKKMTFRQH